jgi:AbrB family looped-hinge helix DNA binding protein
MGCDMGLTCGITHPKMPFMTATTIDKAGRVVIPKALRDELGLAPGDALSVRSDGENVMLRRVRAASSLRKEKGVWVFRSGQNVSAAETDRALDDLRRQRDRAARGGSD